MQMYFFPINFDTQSIINGFMSLLVVSISLKIPFSYISDFLINILNVLPDIDDPHRSDLNGVLN